MKKCCHCKEEVKLLDYKEDYDHKKYIFNYYCAKCEVVFRVAAEIKEIELKKK